MITYNIKMELQSERTMYTDIVLTSGDVKAYRLAFGFCSNGQRSDVTGYILGIKAKRPDGVVIVDTGEITPEGKAVYDIKSNIYDVPGNLTMEVALATEDGCYVTTKELMMTVRQGYGDSGLNAENTTPVLAKLSEQAIRATQAANAAEQATEEAERIMNMTVSAVALESGSEPTVEKSDDGENVTLTFGIPAGAQGEKGDTGEKGETGAAGKDGADGYTPQKGVDYWTETDIEEIKSYVDEAISGGAW